MAKRTSRLPAMPVIYSELLNHKLNESNLRRSQLRPAPWSNPLFYLPQAMPQPDDISTPFTRRNILNPQRADLLKTEGFPGPATIFSANRRRAAGHPAPSQITKHKVCGCLKCALPRPPIE